MKLQAECLEIHFYFTSVLYHFLSIFSLIVKYILVALPILSSWMHVWLIITHCGPFLVAQPTV